jgi:inositol polyphosphate-4-phosphatase
LVLLIKLCYHELITYIFSNHFFSGYCHALNILLPVPESVFCMLPTRETVGYTFKVTPVFFNVGINENATISETLGYTKEQHRSNWDNFDRLKHYHIRYKKLFSNSNTINNFHNENAKISTPNKASSKEQQLQACEKVVTTMLAEMETLLRANTSKNVKILHIAEDITRLLNGLRTTSCKSAKDRTSMSVTLEQVSFLALDFLII